MAIKHERLGMRRNLAFWLPLSCLVHSAPFDFQARDTIPWFYKEEAKAHRRYDFTSVRGIPIKRNNRWIRVSSFVFYLLEDKRHANLISSILERPWLPTLRPLIVPFFFLSFFFSFFFPSPSLSFLANIDPFQPRRVFETSDIMVDIARIVVSGLNFNIPLL